MPRRTGAPGSVDVVVVVPPVGLTGPGKAVLATAVVPVVAAMTATSTAPTPAGTASHARHVLTKVPMRIGRSTRWNDTTDAANVSEHPHGEELVAGDPGAGVVEPDEDRPVPDVEAVGDPPHVAHRRQ